ncbi:hypothetical protein BEWA_025420 [Theileria equi strain WA]|uniref:Uncharacterized protein n=1 Tax=Theileria equi strain WA TaxID=1537102 RepID=L0AWR2_THEEQ|nr:hypothetical protein BEWA_025420 [Theileria equi strain WA]AFZ79693.1 hypothetical protein BEWA_025420 [Theileria equi strain WA]|eukprot:XP_004829359.1 hypothetical protein BEWA_025420 [Theileria equi strain WA]
MDLIDCEQYTLMIGLVKMAEEYLTEDVDLTTIKERVMRKVLNINNYIKNLCDYYDKTKNRRSQGTQLIVDQTAKPENEDPPKEFGTKIEKYVKRNEFFVYSVSMSFNPKIKAVSDLLNASKEGDGVCTITAKMPKDEQKRGFYLRLMLKCISKYAVVLKLQPENNGTVSNKIVKRDQSHETVLKPIPKYFDEDYSESEETTEHTAETKPGIYGMSSFFNQRTQILSKYLQSGIVLRDDDKFANERLLKEKMRTKRVNL